MKKIAGDYHRERRGNCAQSVAFAWGSKFVGARGIEEVFDGCGAGVRQAGSAVPCMPVANWRAPRPQRR